MRIVSAVLGLLLGLTVAAHSAFFSVTTLADSGPGSLRQAIFDAEATPEPDEISLAGLTGVITLESILPTVAGELTITGPGAETLKISGNNRTQVLHVDPTGKLTLSRLSLADGRAEPYLHGGAIQNRGTLLISDCVFSNNHAYGGFGGAIYCEGTLTISDATFTANHVTGGGSVGSGPGGALGGGGGGFGGAIYLRQGTLTLSDSSFNGNFAVGGDGETPFNTGGANYASGTGGGPEGGAGGGQGSPTGLPGLPGGFGSGGGGGGRGSGMGGSITTGGRGGAGGFGGGGGGGGGGTGFPIPQGGSGGAGGFGGGKGAGAADSGVPGGGGAAFGGAIFMENGISSITRVKIIANNCTGGTGGSGPNFGDSIGGGGGAGMGAAVFQYSGTLEMKECLLEANSVTGGRSGLGRIGGGPGALASGGAVFSYRGSCTIAQTTLSSNLATGGAGGPSVRGAIGGDAFGGAIATSEGEVTLTNCTISGNRVFAGSGNLGNGLGDLSTTARPGVASGGAMRTGAALVSLVNCTIANNEAQAGVTSQLSFTQQVIGKVYGGGIYVTGIAPTIQNTLLSGNQLKVDLTTQPPPRPPGGVEITKSDGEGTFNSGGYNLVETSAGMEGLVSTDKRDVPALIEPVANNGGLTPTHALLAGSPAIDGGSDQNAPPMDQRGVTRPQGRAVDIGAFELSALDAIPRTEISFRSSEQVPGEPAGTIFVSFDAPAINEAGQLAFSAKIKTSGVSVPAIFARDRIVARKNSPAPDRTGSPQLQSFSKLLDPVLDEEGNVAFIAAASGRTGIWTDADASILKLIALQGDDAPGVPSGRFAGFSSVSLQGGQLILAATLARGGGINAANDQGIWSWTAKGGLKLQLHEGVTTAAGVETIQSIAMLTPVAGSLAQGRSHTHRSSGRPALVARVTFRNGTQAVLEDDGAGSFRLDALAITGMPIRTNTGSVDERWSSFGIPAWSMDGTRLGLRASMQASEAPGKKGNGLFVDGSDGRLSSRVRKGEPAPESSASPIQGATFASFKDPLIGGTPVELAFLGKLAGRTITSANDEGLWMGTSTGLKLVAREGDVADTSKGERWKAIQSVALGSQRGPVFVATLAPGFGNVTPATRRGLWGVNSFGQLRPLLRPGDSLRFGDTTIQVRRFTALAPAAGAEGTLRGLSASGAHIVVQAQLADGAQALLKVEMP